MMVLFPLPLTARNGNNPAPGAPAAAIDAAVAAPLRPRPAAVDAVRTAGAACTGARRPAAGAAPRVAADGCKRLN